MRTILIVDDSMTSRMLFKAHMPKDLGYEVVEAADGPSALEQATTNRPEWVVLDYNMPGKNGVQIAEDLIEAGIETKFVLLTANTQKSVVDAAMGLGFVGVVDKPVSTDKLLAILKD